MHNDAVGTSIIRISFYSSYKIISRNFNAIFNAIPSIQASMTEKTLEGLTICLHYSDNWELMGDCV